MSIQTQLLTLLDGATTAGTRVYPLTAPEDVQRPYVVYQRVSVAPETVMSGDSGLANTRMQIDVFSETMAQAETIAGQISALLAGWSVQNVPVLTQDFYEDEVKLFRVSTDYSIWHPTT